jgi:hypothetical protein
MEMVREGAGPSKRIAVVVIHGVGETNTGWINESIVDPIGNARRELEMVPHSELHRLSNIGHGDTGATFLTLVRRASMGSENIGFIEMFWADLARVASGPIAYIAAILKLIFEAPDVLARAFLRNRWRGVHGVIGLLVLTSSRLLNWFVVGLNLTVIACSAFMTTVWLLRNAKFLPATLRYDDATVAFWLSPVILAIFVLGVWLFRRARHQDIGLSEFGRGIAVSSAAVLTYVVLATATSYGYFKIPFDLPEFATDFVNQWQPKSDFDRGRFATFLVWVAWCASTLLSMALLLLVGLTRALGWRPANPVPLAATWAAVFNILIQAIVLKLVLSPVSILACSQLRNAYRTYLTGPAGGAMKVDEAENVAKTLCDVDIPSGVFFLTLFETVFILAGLVCILYLRRSAALRNEPNDLPRLIVHPLFIAIAAVTVTAHILVFAEQMLNDLGHHINLIHIPAEGIGYKRLPPELLAFLVWLVPLYIGGIRALYGFASPMVHIARELVDHQYRARPPLFGFLRRSAETTPWIEYPRRAPIAARLDSIMDKLLASQRIDKLIFLTHSQGTVIAFDYLRSREPNEAIKTIGEIHVVTMGSPLSHIYGHYFDEYTRPVNLADLRGNVCSWTNFWRVDDPIGTKVGVVIGDFIKERMLGRGGHVNYWREKEVQKYICGLLELPSPTGAERKQTQAVADGDLPQQSFQPPAAA